MPAPTQQAKDCVHHWLLSAPLGGTVDGECRRCGQRREFDADPSRTRGYGRRAPRRQTKQAS